MDNNHLFNFENKDKPLAERMRPISLKDFVGQDEIAGEGSILKKMIESSSYSSFIFWGPPGSGKTTLAKIIFNSTDAECKSISAVTSGIKEAKQIMDEAVDNLRIYGKKTILFVDEIHRFNKAQQDAFLPYVENGTITLIGATTENPSFSVISPLLSRMRVLTLNKLTDQEIGLLIEKAIDLLKKEDNLKIKIGPESKSQIVKVSSGDARRAYGILEISIKLAKTKDDNSLVINGDILKKALMGRFPNYDKKGDYHYDFISALHKSMRNSDCNAAAYYAVKMLESGEDPLYVIRRVIEFSTEDVGLADPNALLISIAARDTLLALGMPEARYAILEAVIYNSLAPKSNSLLEAYNRAASDIKNNPDVSVPLQLRNAPTDLMKDMGYGADYKYAHNEKIPVTDMQCLPEELKDRVYYSPKDYGHEKKLKEVIEKIKKLKSK